MVLLLLGTVIGSFVRSQEPSRVPARTEAAREAPAVTGDRNQRVQVPWHAAWAACWVQPVAEDGHLLRRGPNDHRTGDARNVETA
ncbi:MAG: hypothetical protein AB7F99_19615 [Vicinamibacterales bacterium]